MSGPLDIYEAKSGFAKAAHLLEAQAIADLQRGYQAAWSRLESGYRLLAERVEANRKAGLPVRPGDLYRMERFQALMVEVNATYRDLARQANGIVNGTVGAAMDRAIDDYGDLLKTLRDSGVTLPPGMGDWNVGINRDAALAALGYTAETSPLADLLRKHGEASYRASRDTLVGGIVAGKGSNVVASDLKRILGASLWRSQLIARTEMHRAYRDVGRQTASHSPEVFTGWMWRAACDSKTCAICWERHGTIYDTKEVMRTHPGCRCALIPVPQGMAAMVVDASIFKRGPDLFRALPPARQLKVLGPGRFALYQRGVPLSDMIRMTKRGRWGEQPTLVRLRDLPRGRTGAGPPPPLSPPMPTAPAALDYGPDPFGNRSADAMELARRIRESPAVKASHNWPTTRPWDATADDIAAGRVPGLTPRPAGRVIAGDDVVAFANYAGDGTIQIDLAKWATLTPNRRAHFLYHELGHFGTASALADPTIRARLLDAMRANEFDRRTPGETLAWGYTKTATSHPPKDYDAGQLVTVPEDKAMWDLFHREAAFMGLPRGTQVILTGKGDLVGFPTGVPKPPSAPAAPTPTPRVPPGNPKDALMDGIVLGWPGKVFEKGFLYHGAPAAAFPGIRANGLLPNKYRIDDKGPWEDVVFFGEHNQVQGPINHAFQSQGHGVLLRIREGAFTPDQKFGDVVAHRAIKPGELEYFGNDGSWHPLIGRTKPVTPITPTKAPTPKGQTPVPAQPKPVSNVPPPPPTPAPKAPSPAKIAPTPKPTTAAATPVRKVSFVAGMPTYPPQPSRVVTAPSLPWVFKPLPGGKMRVPAVPKGARQMNAAELKVHAMELAQGRPGLIWKQGSRPGQGEWVAGSLLWKPPTKAGQKGKWVRSTGPAPAPAKGPTPPPPPKPPSFPAQPSRIALSRTFRVRLPAVPKGARPMNSVEIEAQVKQVAVGAPDLVWVPSPAGVPGRGVWRPPATQTKPPVSPPKPWSADTRARFHDARHPIPPPGPLPTGWRPMNAGEWDRHVRRLAANEVGLEWIPAGGGLRAHWGRPLAVKPPTPVKPPSPFPAQPSRLTPAVVGTVARVVRLPPVPKGARPMNPREKAMQAQQKAIGGPDLVWQPVRAAGRVAGRPAGATIPGMGDWVVPAPKVPTPAAANIPPGHVMPRTARGQHRVLGGAPPPANLPDAQRRRWVRWQAENPNAPAWKRPPPAALKPGRPSTIRGIGIRQAVQRAANQQPIWRPGMAPTVKARRAGAVPPQAAVRPAAAGRVGPFTPSQRARLLDQRHPPVPRTGRAPHGWRPMNAAEWNRHLNLLAAGRPGLIWKPTRAGLGGRPAHWGAPPLGPGGFGAKPKPPTPVQALEPLPVSKPKNLPPATSGTLKTGARTKAGQNTHGLVDGMTPETPTSPMNLPPGAKSWPADRVVARRILTGPVTSIRPNNVRSASTTYKGEIDGVPVIIKPTSGQYRGIRPHIPDYGETEREYGGAVVMRHLGSPLQHQNTVIRDLGTVDIGGQRYNLGRCVVSSLNEPPPGYHRPHAASLAGVSDEEKMLASLYDALIANTDRHGGNYFSDPIFGTNLQWRLVAIDPSLGFPVARSRTDHIAAVGQDWTQRSIPLTPQAKERLRVFLMDEVAIRAELEPMMGRDPVDQMFARARWMWKHGRTLATREVMNPDTWWDEI